MRFRPAWQYIDGIRDFTRFFCNTTFSDTEVAERAQMIIQETLENAVKYSSPGPRSELELSIDTAGGQLDISVVSRPDPQHLGALRQQLDELYERDAEGAYIAAFERAAKNPDASARLGLARIRYEGRVEINLHDEADGRIRVTSRGEL
jgi:hypothetical protein